MGECSQNTEMIWKEQTSGGEGEADDHLGGCFVRSTTVRTGGVADMRKITVRYRTLSTRR